MAVTIEAAAAASPHGAVVLAENVGPSPLVLPPEFLDGSGSGA